MSDTNLPLPQFYAHTLSSLLPVFDDSLSTSSSDAQAILSKALDNLHLISRMITTLGLFSSNETLDELGDSEAVFMTVQYVIGECEAKTGLAGPSTRREALDRATVSLSRCADSAADRQTAYESFFSLTGHYGILPPDQLAESSAMAEGALPKDPARRREAKIRQYKREKDLRQQLSVG